MVAISVFCTAKTGVVAEIPIMTISSLFSSIQQISNFHHQFPNGAGPLKREAWPNYILLFTFLSDIATGHERMSRFEFDKALWSSLRE